MEQAEYLELKASVTDSDSNAVIRTGKGAIELLPVYLQTTGSDQKLLVERNGEFTIASAVLGFQRFELKPEFRKEQITEAINAFARA
jgi:hypothetical protein